MKTCNKCESEKRNESFHKRAASKDGLSAVCRGCQSLYDRARRDLPKRMLARSVYAGTAKGKEAGRRAKNAWFQRNKGKVVEIVRRYRAENPIKTKAHGIVGYAIKQGFLLREPCAECGKTGGVHAHHDDYSKPLEVRWLCAAHHSQWHSINGEAKNAA